MRFEFLVFEQSQLDWVASVFRLRTYLHLRSNRVIGGVRFNAVLLRGVVTRNHRASRGRGTKVDCLVRYAGGNEQKVSSLTDGLVLEIDTPTRQDGSFEHVDACLIAEMDVGFCSRPRR